MIAIPSVGSLGGQRQCRREPQQQRQRVGQLAQQRGEQAAAFSTTRTLGPVTASRCSASTWTGPTSQLQPEQDGGLTSSRSASGAGAPAEVVSTRTCPRWARSTAS